MEILNIRIMNGPNYWSVKRQQLVVMLLDLQELEQRPSNKIPGFSERLKALLPSLYEHRCSEGQPGGFFQRLEEGTWMGHVIEHVALEMQTLAGMDTGFGRTRQSDRPGVYHVVFSYISPKAGEYAARSSVALVQALINNEAYNLEQELQQLRAIGDQERLGPSTAAIVEEAKRRNIPVTRLNRHSLVQLGYGARQRRIQATIASTTSSIAVDLACDKEETKRILEAASVPVPSGVVIRDSAELPAAIGQIGFPMVIKPLSGNQGKGATTDIRDADSAAAAFTAAQQYGRSVICERFISGRDFRVLVINYKFVAAALRTPASVTGDGRHSIAELVAQVNADPRRGAGHEKVLTRIRLDDAAILMLEKYGYSTDTVLPEGLECWLQPTANLSTGGTARDVTDEVHPANIAMCERIARLIGLDICGIDIMAEDLARPMAETGAAVLEVNAAPGFRMHLAPAEGQPRNVAAPVIDMLFPQDTSARIPIIAVTGTNGKTTTTRLLAHIVRQAGHQVGYTTTDGVYIQEQLMMAGDCTGPVSAEFVLRDPTVDFAVLETARGGILRAGLGFSNCNVAVVTNIAEDHLGLNGIDTIEKLARVKAVVPGTVFPDGYAVLNADDDRVYALREGLNCRIALFSLDAQHPRIRSHCAAGGMAAVYENGYITILNGDDRLPVAAVTAIPVTFSGKAEFNVYNVLGAALAAYAQGLSLEAIRQALESFIPSPNQTPGRMNIFRFRDFTVMLDYAHNTHGIHALGKFVSSVTATLKVGIIAAVGDRRDEDIISLGAESGMIFDEIIIRQDKNMRGRDEKELIDLLEQGIRKVRPGMKIMVIPREKDAIDYAIRNARQGAFITVISDVVPDALEQVSRYKDQDTGLVLPMGAMSNCG